MVSRGINLKKLDQLLTIPGSGVFTVNTGKEKKERLLKQYYKTTSPVKANKEWLKRLSNISASTPLLLGIPSDNGGGIHRGANWGPLAIREELLKHNVDFQDLGDVRVIPHLLHDKYLNEKTIQDCRLALYGKKIKLPVSPLSIAEEALTRIYNSQPNIKIFGVGGDHSTSYPLVKTWLASRKSKATAALIHFDAHTDLLDKRMGIDLCFGTWTYHILRHLSSPKHIIQLGIRSSAKTKSHWKKKLGVEQYWAHEINKWGIQKTYNKLKKHLKKLEISELYISFDIDALDEKYASATGTPEPDGLNPADCSALFHLLSKDFKITGSDLMEVAPYVHHPGVNPDVQNSSMMMAGHIAKKLLEALSL